MFSKLNHCTRIRIEQHCNNYDWPLDTATASEDSSIGSGNTVLLLLCRRWKLISNCNFMAVVVLLRRSSEKKRRERVWLPALGGRCAHWSCQSAQKFNDGSDRRATCKKHRRDACRICFYELCSIVLRSILLLL